MRILDGPWALANRTGRDPAHPQPRARRRPPHLPQVDALSNPGQDVEPVGRSRQAGHWPRADDLLLELVLGAEGTE